LGESLRSGEFGSLPWQEDALMGYQEMCEATEATVRKILENAFPDLKIYSRTKTSKSITEKLIRSPNMKLSRMDDPVGLRLVKNVTLAEQDLLANQLLNLVNVKQIKDRRIHDSNGYRALHIIARTELIHVEIQVRTTLQDEWAFMFEQLADSWGRQIRYDQPQGFQTYKPATERLDMVSKMISYSLINIAEFENNFNRLTLNETNSQQELITGIVSLTSQAQEISESERGN
jgi:ppGpp synthetase/RelA/SpoT-type nucleotidyltranferase